MILGNTILYGLLISILLLSLVASSTLYWIRKDYLPIKGRPHLLIFISVWSLCIIALVWSLPGVIPGFQHIPCGFMIVATYVCTFMLNLSVFLRLRILHLEHKICQLKVKLGADMEHDKESEVPVKKLQRHMTRYPWVMLLMFCFSIGAGIATFGQFSEGQYNLQAFEMLKDGLSFTDACRDVIERFGIRVFVSLIAVALVAKLWLMFLLRNQQDNLFVKRELVLSVATSVILMVFVIVFRLNPIKQYLFGTGYDFGSLFLMTSAFTLIFLLVDKVRLSFSDVFAAPVENVFDKPGLMKAISSKCLVPVSMVDLKSQMLSILQDSNGYLALQKFLEKEWSVENIFFWSSVETYKQKGSNCTEEQLLEMASVVFSKYIDANAAMCVNLPFSITKDIKEKFQAQRVDIDIFSDAQNEIFSLMLRDSFRRFLLDDIYKQYKNGTSQGTEYISSKRHKTSEVTLPLLGNTYGKVM